MQAGSGGGLSLARLPREPEAETRKPVQGPSVRPAKTARKLPGRLVRTVFLSTTPEAETVTRTRSLGLKLRPSTVKGERSTRRRRGGRLTAEGAEAPSARPISADTTIPASFIDRTIVARAR